VLRREIRLVVEHLCDTEETLLNRNERERLIEEVLDETFGLGPLEMLLKDPTISDILINGPKNIYVERRGKLEKTNVEFRDNSTCCRSSTASCRRSAAAWTKSARWSTPACPTAPA
jgi:pilus assembly protein CpaF